MERAFSDMKEHVEGLLDRLEVFDKKRADWWRYDLAFKAPEQWPGIAPVIQSEVDEHEHTQRAGDV